MDRRKLRMLIKRVLRDSPFSLQELSRETGLSYDALWSWASGRRTPRAENVERLAAFLERHGKRLQDFAEDLRKASQPDPP